MGRPVRRFHTTVVLISILLSAFAATIHADSVVGDFIITYNDAAGFFSGGTGTAGAAHRASLEYAVGIWNAWLPKNDTVPIRIKVETPTAPPGLQQWDNILGYSDASYLWQLTGSSLPVSGALYPDALADYLYGSDIYRLAYPHGTNDYDMEIGFNPYWSWYVPTTGSPGSQIDFASVALHEIGHGMGFTGGLYYDGGWQWQYSVASGPVWAIYDTFLESGGTPLTSMTADQRAAAVTSDALYWDGAKGEAANGGNPVQVYAPTSYSGGSSIYHLDYAAQTQPTYYLMSPYRGYGEVRHSISPLETAMLNDMGWNGGAVPTPEPAAIVLLLTSPPLAVLLRRRRRRR